MSEFPRSAPETILLLREEEKLPQTPEKDFELELTVERLKRHLDVAAIIEDLEADKPLSAATRKKIAAIIEGRGWNTLFETIKNDDEVAVFVVPTGAYAIKNLNDSIFGPQGADVVIEQQKAILRNVMSAYGFTLLRQDYKTSFFQVNGATQEVLDMIAATVQAQLDLYVQQKVKEYKKQHQAKGQSFGHLDEFKQNSKEGYKLSYGMSVVESRDYADIELAILEGLQGAKYAQLMKNEDGHYGETHDSEKILRTTERTKAIRDIVFSKGNSLVDDVDTRYVVFESNMESGQFHLNRHLLRVLRKGTLKPKSAKDQEIVRLLNEYKQIINLLDSVKPYTHDEITGEDTSGVNLHKNLLEEREVANGLKNVDFPFDREYRLKAAAILKRDQKDGKCTSPPVFHKTAIETTPDCTYVSIDVLDVGVDLLLEYEQAYMKIEQAVPSEKKKLLQLAMVEAGDKKTLELRAIRERVKNFCTTKFKKEIPMLVGGDEITLALSSKLVDEDFLFGLRTASGSRVVTSEVERAKISDDANKDKDALCRLHAQAIKEAEAGITIAKKIEEMINARERGILVSPEQAAPSLVALFEVLKKGFVVKEERGTFYLVTKGEEELPLTVDHDRISVTKDGNRMFVYGAALVFLLAFFVWK